MTQTYLKVTKSPTPPVGPTYPPQTMWLVPSPTSGFLDIYISNAAGTEVKKTPTVDHITNMIASALANYGNTIVVANITERNDLELLAVTQVYVIDATGDPTVETGAAVYLYNPVGDTYTKIQELATIDAIVNWSSIQGKPTSSVANIDDAVNKRHSHANLTSLNKIGEDAEGFPTYGGNNFHILLSEAGW